MVKILLLIITTFLISYISTFSVIDNVPTYNIFNKKWWVEKFDQIYTNPFTEKICISNTTMFQIMIENFITYTTIFIFIIITFFKY